jgi:lysophospholipase L1-like esterase
MNSLIRSILLFLACVVSCQAAEKSRLVTRLEAGSKQVVVAYGTSLTANGAWVTQMAGVLNERFPGLATVVRSGGSGQWSEWGVRNLEKRVLGKKPDTVFIEFSINDSVERFKGSVEVAKANLEKMTDAIRKTNPQCEIILMTMTPGDSYPEGHYSHRKDIEAHYEMYRSVAKVKNFLLIDHYPNWKALQASDKELYQKYIPDGIHPTALGCARVVTPLILTALGIEPPVPIEVSEEAAFYYRTANERKPAVRDCEVAVYGGTPAGVTAAIQSARMGRKTVLLSFHRHVGGMTSGGLTATDLGNKDSIGGIAKEFYTRLGRITDFSASEAETLYLAMLKEAGVMVLFDQHLESVEMKESRIVSVTMETGQTIKAGVFIDSTYEGDLMAAAKVSYRVGREPMAAFNETLAGQWQQVSWKNVYQFCQLPISPFVNSGDPASGLLPEISAEKAGAPGEGDYRVQAYNFRMDLSNKDDRVPFPKPKDYDPARYGLLARFLNADPAIQWRLNYTTQAMTDGPVQMRNGDSNNAGSFSSDYVGGSNRWPDGTFQPTSFNELPSPRRGLPVSLRELYGLRERIFQDHVTYQQGLLYFLANDPQVPKELQQRVKQFGLDPAEFTQSGHWPHQLYVREERRMDSDYVMTQADCESKRAAEDSVGLASYPMDSHFCQRVVVQENGKATVRNEGGFGGVNCPKPYPISYRSIVPKRGECSNLLVPVCLSSSHVAYGSIRMEPVFMILGQSAGAAASLAVDRKLAVQEVAYPELLEKLKSAKQVLRP